MQNFFATGKGEPEPPEPVIGKGMILERGRVRVVVGEFSNYNCNRRCVRFRRWPLMQWPLTGTPFNADAEEFTMMLASGFRVIRHADPIDPK